jgi:prepilin-type N-terminal cleavage/methylation domain-containing protein
MLTNRFRCTAHSSSRSGFTLVELLVVIGIIAILAGVALGPITNGIKKAKQSAGMQQSHSIGLAMYSCANDNNQLYPGKSGGNGTAGDVAAILLAGGYVSDATIFGLSGDTNTNYAKVSSATNTATSITQAQVSWDFMVSNDGSGVSSTSFPFLPLVWSTINGSSGLPAFTTLTANAAITASPIATNPFGKDGMAIFYINNAANFISSSVTGAGGTPVVTMVSAANNLGGGATKYVIASGD